MTFPIFECHQQRKNAKDIVSRKEGIVIKSKADVEAELDKRIQQKRDELNEFEEGERKGGLFKKLESLPSNKIEGGVFSVGNNPNSFTGFHRGGGLREGNLALIGESSSGRGGELVYSGNDAMVLNQSRTDQLLTMALEKGLSGGGGNNAPTIITTDNSVRSNTSNMISSPSMITSNDSLMNSITNSV